MNAQTREDCELLRRCRAGDPDAFGDFYRRHREALLGYLARRTPSPELAADLMAETFARALGEVLTTTRPIPGAPAAWLFTIARNLLVDSLRRRRVDSAARRRLALEPLVLEDEDINRVIEAGEAADRLDAVKASVSPADWALLRARLGEELPYSELAAQLRCSEAVVRKRVSRASDQARATGAKPEFETARHTR